MNVNGTESHRYLNHLRPGQEVVVDGRRYARCLACRKIVRVDKLISGSLHLCVEE